MVTGLVHTSARAQNSSQSESSPSTKTTFVRLGNDANAILVETVTPISAKNHIGILVTHPEHNNNFNYFHGLELANYGYRVLMLNYYGPEETYYELYAPIAAAIKALRGIPGVEKVVLAGHSSGGAEITSYQDVAENGPKACQQPGRIYKCQPKGLENLPKADGVMLLDCNSGAPIRILGLNPAIDAHRPLENNVALDMFDPKNGFNPATRSATYSKEFLDRYFEAQGEKANRVIDEALARLSKIEKGEGDYKDDEPFVVAGASGNGRGGSGAHPEQADVRLLSKTHAPHLLLKADGSKSVQVISKVGAPGARPDDQDKLFLTTVDVTVRHYLTFQALRVTPQYRMTENGIAGVDWRSSPNSMQGNLEGVHVPTLVMSATCGAELVLHEIAYDHSAAKDKDLVGVEGANHEFQPCRPEYAGTFRRTFDYIDGWLSKPSRF